MVRRRERAAASRGDRAVGRDRRSVAHRAVRGHGVLADQRRVGVPHARAHAAEHRELDIGPALSAISRSSDLPQRLGCGDVPLWDRWIAHPTLDAYWRAHAVTTNIAKVRAPVLQISGWYDDSRGPIDYTNALLSRPGPSVHPARHGSRRAQGSRLRGRRLRPAVARRHAPAAAPLVRSLPARQGQRRRPRAAGRHLRRSATTSWRKEAAWPLARAVPTKWYCRRSGQREHERGRRRARHAAAERRGRDTFTYDPANPTPFLIDSRELETSLNEDFTALNATRRDELVFTSKPLTQADRGDGPDVGASLWAATDAKDTDWNVMLLDVFPDGHAERVQDGVVRARFRKGFDKEVLAHAGQRRALRHRSVVHVARVRAGPPRFA